VDRVPPNGSRVAVPRSRAAYTGGGYSRGYNTYRHYGGKNVYVVPRGRTYYYYPRYYYNPYAYGYGPAGEVTSTSTSPTTRTSGIRTASIATTPTAALAIQSASCG
jgi:hypothetical protein